MCFMHLLEFYRNKCLKYTVVTLVLCFHKASKQNTRLKTVLRFSTTRKKHSKNLDILYAKRIAQKYRSEFEQFDY